TVSRQHTRIWIASDGWWVEDMGSKYGTQVNGVKIGYKRQLNAGDVVQVGETQLAISFPEQIADTESAGIPGTNIARSLDARIEQEVYSRVHDPAKSRFAPLGDLPDKLEAAETVEAILEIILQYTAKALPAAERSAILLLDTSEDRLILKAHGGAGVPPTHQGLARRALDQMKGMIFSRGADGAEVAAAVQ